MYKENVTITSVDVDQNLELRLSNLFKYFQLVGSNHVKKLGASHQDLINHNVLWVVIRMDVKIFRMPKLDEEVVFMTHPGETRSFVFPRHFHVFDKKGNLIISSSSMWALMDKDTRKVVLKPEGLVKIKSESSKYDLPLPDKVVGDAPSKIMTNKVRYTDIDLNGHLNNTSYIEFILNTHKPEFYKENKISSISINYDKEIRSTDEVTLCSNNSNPEIIKGNVGEFTHFAAKLEYIKR